jgi:hypothetical protein
MNASGCSFMSKSKPEELPSEPILYEIAFEPALYAQLEDYAKSYALDMEQVIIAAVEQYLEE